MPTPKKRVKKGRTIKGWALFKYDDPEFKHLRYDPDIGQFKIYANKAFAERGSWGAFHVIKPVLIKIEE